MGLISTSMLLASLAVCAIARNAEPAPKKTDMPRTFLYREVSGQKLHIYVFSPNNQVTGKQTSCMLLIHGGGWTLGQAEWMFDDARHFAAMGITSVAVEYRLSLASVTPIDALEDVYAAFRWVRQHSKELNIDPHRVAGYGQSAGGHLAAAAGVGCHDKEPILPDMKPDVLLLMSPALEVVSDQWFKSLLPSHVNPSTYSPAEQAGSATPPTCIVTGDKDSVTPLAGIQRFCDRVRAKGCVCELHAYPGVGHMFTRNLANQLSDFDMDPKTVEDSNAQLDRFLRAQGYIPTH
jgi:acetyl esterase